MNTPIIVICGPTASGKSSLVLRLAQELPVEIINADSQQVYCGLDIGTAKPSLSEQASVPHHLIDIVTPSQSFSAADFIHLADLAISDISARGKIPAIVGGTGLYIRALLHGLVDSPSGSTDIRARLQLELTENGPMSLYDRLKMVDPTSAARIHPNNTVRIIRALEVYEITGFSISEHQEKHGFEDTRYNFLQIGLSVERQELYRRIDHRVDKMMQEGLLSEVEQLLADGVYPSAKGMGAIGYKELVAFLAGEYDLKEAVRLIKRNSRHYAKRQMTWFQGDHEIRWFDYPEKYATICSNVIDFLGYKERNYGKSTV